MYRSLLSLAVVGTLAVAGCSSGDDSPADDGGGAGTVAAQADTGDQSDNAGDSAEQQALLGVTVSGPPGTVVELSAVAVAQGEEQPPLEWVFTIEDEEERFLFSGFVESAVATFEVTEGGPAVVSTITGAAVDPENPFAGVDVLQTFETAEAELGEPVELALPS